MYVLENKKFPKNANQNVYKPFCSGENMDPGVHEAFKEVVAKFRDKGIVIHDESACDILGTVWLGIESKDKELITALFGLAARYGRMYGLMPGRLTARALNEFRSYNSDGSTPFYMWPIGNMIPIVLAAKSISAQGVKSIDDLLQKGQWIFKLDVGPDQPKGALEELYGVLDKLIRF